MARVSVITLNWNGTKVLSECLEGLHSQTYQSFSTIVVDNGSTDGSVDFVRRNYPEVNLVALDKNAGFCVANNIAIRSVETEYVALLNNDAVPDPLWLSKLVQAMDSHPEAGLVASKMLFYDDPERIDRAGDSYTIAGVALLRGCGESSANYDEEVSIFGACAGAALYRTEMLKEIGLFDEDFFLLYEDVDLSFRAQLRGYKCLYVPNAIVYHRASSSIGYDSSISVYYSHRNLEWVYIKNMPTKLLLKTIWLHIIFDIGAFFFFGTNGRIKEFIKAKWDAIKGMKRILKKRWQIQNHRRVDGNYIWGLLEEELFFSRLIRRLRRNRERGKWEMKNLRDKSH